MTLGDTLRVPVVRRDKDGTVVDGTALWEDQGTPGFMLSDFRDLDGNPMSLPPGSSFEIMEL